MSYLIKILSVTASIFSVFSAGTYFKQVITGESVPNPATWLIWFVVTIMNTISYFLVVSGNVWVSLASMALAVEIFVIFVFSIFKGKFSRLGFVEIISLVLCLLVGIFWKLSGNTLISNLALQAIFLISFYPTMHGLLRRVSKEKPLPWLFASASYILQIVNIFFNPVTLLALAFPIVNLIGNATIGVIALWQHRQSFMKSGT